MICRMGVELADVVTHAKFGDDQFRHFFMVEGQISGFPTDLRSRPYNDLALLCRSVMNLFLCCTTATNSF